MAYQPKSYKKFVATAATATLVASAIAPVASASFTDVNSNYTNAVDYLVQHGIANGFTETTFGITADIKRGDAAVMIANALGLDTDAAADQGFTDLNTRVAGAVNAIVEAGIANGKTETTFAPDLPITRQEVAKMLANAYGLTATTDAGFEDVNSNWMPYVSALVEAEVAFGYNDTTFGSTDKVTRGQFALFVYRAEGSPIPAPAVASLDINAEGDEFTLVFGEALPEGADLNYVLENYDIQVNGSEITEAQVTALDLKLKSASADMKTVVVSHTDLDELATTLGGTSVSLQIGGKSDVHTFDLTAEVVSVSAINANEIQITFNKELNKASAETEANYTIDTAALAGADAVTLNADKKSVTIKFATDGTGVFLDGLLDNNKAYEVAALKGILAADGTVLESTQSKTILFVDKTAPVLSAITSLENGNVVVSFNERLDVATKPAIVLNEVTVNPTNVTVNANGTVTILATDAAVAGLASGQSYTAVVSGAKDLIGNTMGLVTKTFTYVVKNAEPTLLTATADGETSIELEFDEALSTNLVNNVTVKVYKGAQQITSTPTTADNTTFDLGLSYADVFAAGENSVNLTVVVEGYKDVQGNLGQKITRNVTVTKDVVKPTVTKTAYDAATGEVTLTFSEELDAATQADYAAKMFVTDINGVKYNVVPTISGTGATELLTLADVVAGDKTISFNATEFANGTYALTIQSGALTDTANTANAIATTSVNFTKGNVSDADAPTFDAAVEVVKGQFTASFSEPVKGGAVSGSATALSNYKLNGAALPAGTTIYLNETKDIATITLPANAITTSGVKLLTVNNVQDLSGKAMAETTRTISLTENTNPVLTSAKVVNNSELELTFSENVNNAVALDFSDFEVTVNGIAVTEGVNVIASPSANNKFVIAVTDANLATGTIVVKVADNADATDAAANALVTGTTVTATR